MINALTIAIEPRHRFGWLDAVASGLRAAGRTLWHLLVRIVEHRRRKRMMAALAALDNHVLKDIGIGRSEIPYLVITGRNMADETKRQQRTMP
ncbi:MAG: DUF1127 domain-containing protein [Pseudolabrys sp.]|nr:DUF1127 domain-containing protein [Pseudolabrys sp.]